MFIPQAKKNLIAGIIILGLSSSILLPMSQSYPAPKGFHKWTNQIGASKTFPQSHGKQTRSALNQELRKPLLKDSENNNQAAVITIPQEQPAAKTKKKDSELLAIAQDYARDYERVHSRSFASAKEFDERADLQKSQSTEAEIKKQASCRDKFNACMSSRAANITTGLMGIGTAAVCLYSLNHEDERSDFMDAVFIGDSVIALAQGAYGAADYLAECRKNKTQTGPQDEIDSQDVKPSCRKKALNVLYNGANILLGLFGLGVSATYLWDYADPKFDAPNDLYKASAYLGLLQTTTSLVSEAQRAAQEKIIQRQKTERNLRGKGESMELRDISFSSLPTRQTNGSCELTACTHGALDQAAQIKATTQPLLSSSVAIDIPAKPIEQNAV